MNTRPPTYQPLATYLARQSRDRVALRFEQMAAMLGAPLPIDASLRSWWRRPGPETVSAALAAVGWQVSRVDPPERRVVFQRRHPVSTTVSTAPPRALR